MHNGSCKWTASGQADMQGAAAAVSVCVCLSGLWDVLAIPQSKVVNTHTHRDRDTLAHRDEMGCHTYLEGATDAWVGKLIPWLTESVG